MHGGRSAIHEHELGWMLYKDRRGKQRRTKLEGVPYSSYPIGVFEFVVLHVDMSCQHMTIELLLDLMRNLAHLHKLSVRQRHNH